MNAILISCLLMVTQDSPAPSPFERALHWESEAEGVSVSGDSDSWFPMRGNDLFDARLEDPTVIRAQNTYEDPVEEAPEAQLAPSPGYQSPFMPTPYHYDPFSQPCPEMGYYDPWSDAFMYGHLGPPPIRYGWGSYWDGAYLFEENTNGFGNLAVTEVNAGLNWRIPLGPSVFFTWTPGVDVRFWDGPDGVDLPGDVYDLKSDWELVSVSGPWSLQLGFTPHYATDFQSGGGSDAFNFDGRAALMFRASPELLMAFGVMYLDRVTDRILPYAGVVWTPDDRWEFRILFPKSRISFFLGDVGGAGVWLYGSGGYHIEAYEIDATLGDDQIEMSDWRLMLGLRSEAQGVSSFIEGGWILDRQADFKGKNTDFDIDDGFIIRAGLRF